MIALALFGCVGFGVLVGFFIGASYIYDKVVYPMQQSDITNRLS